MADFYSYLDASTDGTKNRVRIWKKAQAMKADGATWLRVTAVDESHKPIGEGAIAAGYWLEGWRERQLNDPSFDPPLTTVDA